MVDLAALDTRTPENEEASRRRVDVLVAAWQDREPTWDLSDLKAGVFKTATAGSSTSLRIEHSNELGPTVSRVISDIKSLHSLDPQDDKRPGWFRQTGILTRR